MSRHMLFLRRSVHISESPGGPGVPSPPAVPALPHPRETHLSLGAQKGIPSHTAPIHKEWD